MSLQRNVFDILERTATGPCRERPAVGFEGTQRTFQELHERASRVADGLAAKGVGRGDPVAVMMSNRLEWPEVFFGLAALGAVCVPVNVLLSGPEIEHVCNDSRSRVLIIDEIASSKTDRVSCRFDLVVTVGDADGSSLGPTVKYDELMVKDHVASRPPGPDLYDPFSLYYSSGTTGLPKAATHDHNAIMWNAAEQIIGLGLTSAVRYAVIPSMSWAAGLHNLFTALIWTGGYSEIRRTGATKIDDIVSMLVESNITHTFLVPSLLRELVARPDLLGKVRASTLEWVVTGSEPVPRKIIEQCLAEMPDVAVCQGYGLSEFPTITTVLRPEEVAEHDGSAGRAMPLTRLAVRDTDGDIRSAGRGELLIRSPATMVGYHAKPDETAVAFRDGWLHTGDLVEVDDEGFVTVVGRTKDMIISGGLNVYPKEIEDVVIRIPGIREVAVVGVAHSRFGETPVAVIVTEDDEFDIETVNRVCRDQLAGYKRPSAVIVRTTALPRSANSKVLKRELQPWAQAEVDRKQGADLDADT